MRLLVTLLFLGFPLMIFAQSSFEAIIIDAENKEPLIGATVILSETQGVISDSEGRILIDGIITQSVTVTVSYVGFESITLTYELPLTGIVTIALYHDHELEEVIVISMRSSRTIEDVPTRVELLGAEELEEKAIMKSANIAMLLRESTGIQMQRTSVTSASQNIRIQGLDGRYTQLLKDGFPLFGGFASGLSIMQIPPLDLQQVEVIKGSTSTLYGGGAIAGLVNLVTIQPEEERKLKLMLDQTSALGSTINGFYAKRNDKVGLTFFTSLNRQKAYDPNEDKFSDLPEIQGLTINPSLYFYFNPNSHLRVTLNSTFENRLGGDMDLISGESPFGIHQFTEENKSSRLSYQVTYKNSLDKGDLVLKHSTTKFDRSITEPWSVFKGRQWSTFSEASYSFGEKSEWIGGLNLYTDLFTESVQVGPARDYNYLTAGLFAQNTYSLSDKYILETGMRLDLDKDFGIFPLPRVSLLAKISSNLSMRLGGGLGYKQPSLFTEEAESLAFQGILPIPLDDTDAERSYGANFDLNYKVAFAEDWTFSVNQLFFYTQLNNALVFREGANDTYSLENADGFVDSRGVETNLKLTYKDFKLFWNYALNDTRLQYDNLNEQKALTPKHYMGAVLIYEEHGKWRLGLESYYTGKQFRTDRTETQDYWIVGFMAMRKLGNISLYLNFENFTDTRQHRLEVFEASDHFRPSLPQIWAPTDGFVINGGIILDF